jgi:hypothetical protein
MFLLVLCDFYFYIFLEVCLIMGFDIVKFIWRFFKWGLSSGFFNSKSFNFSFITFFGSRSKIKFGSNGHITNSLMLEIVWVLIFITY